MGDHRSDGGTPGRRHAHPGGSTSGRHRTAGLDSPGHGSRDVLDGAELEALLAAALIRDRIDADAEQRAVAAFRAARDAGAHRARTRRRDDWRPRERRFPGRSLKATLSVLFASLTLGGVAVAAIGSVGSTDGAGDRGRPPASTRAPGAPAGEPSDAGTASTRPDRPASARPDRPTPAQDTEAHCRAYEQAGGRGQAMDATAWRRLVEAAGGERNVTEYCAGQLARARSEAKPDSTAKPERSAGAPGATGADNGSGNAGGGSEGNGSGSGGTGSGSGGTGSGEAQSGGSGAAGGAASGSKGKPAQPNSRRP